MTINHCGYYLTYTGFLTAIMCRIQMLESIYILILISKISLFQFIIAGSFGFTAGKYRTNCLVRKVLFLVFWDPIITHKICYKTIMNIYQSFVTTNSYPKILCTATHDLCSLGYLRYIYVVNTQLQGTASQIVILRPSFLLWLVEMRVNILNVTRWMLHGKMDLLTFSGDLFSLNAMPQYVFDT